MPTKFRPSMKQRMKGGGMQTVHFYMHTTSTEELLEYINNPSSKPKVRQKCRNELTRRGVSYDSATG